MLADAEIVEGSERLGYWPIRGETFELGVGEQSGICLPSLEVLRAANEPASNNDRWLREDGMSCLHVLLHGQAAAARSLHLLANAHEELQPSHARRQ